MKIFLTGGTGFTGEEFIKLAAEKHKITAIYRNKPGRQYKNVKWVKADLTESGDFDKLNGSYEAIVHIGGATPNRAYRDNSFAATTEGTRNLLNFAKKSKAKKFIFVSSISVLIDQPGPYTGSKLAAEKMVKESGINFVIIRPTTIVGAKATDFQRIVRMIKISPIMPLIEPDKAVVQPITAKDLCRIILETAATKTEDRKTIYATGVGVFTLREFVNMVAAYFHHKMIIIPVPLTLAEITAIIAEKLNRRWGLNPERVRMVALDKQIRPGREFRVKIGVSKWLTKETCPIS